MTAPRFRKKDRIAPAHTPRPDTPPQGDDEPLERDVAENETDKQGPESERALDEPVTRFPAG